MCTVGLTGSLALTGDLKTFVDWNEELILAFSVSCCSHPVSVLKIGKRQVVMDVRASIKKAELKN